MEEWKENFYDPNRKRSCQIFLISIGSLHKVQCLLQAQLGGNISQFTVLIHRNFPDDTDKVMEKRNELQREGRRLVWFWLYLVAQDEAIAVVFQDLSPAHQDAA